jgi:hypothetical protein
MVPFTVQVGSIEYPDPGLTQASGAPVVAVLLLIRQKEEKLANPPARAQPPPAFLPPRYPVHGHRGTAEGRQGLRSCEEEPPACVPGAIIHK